MNLRDIRYRDVISIGRDPNITYVDNIPVPTAELRQVIEVRVAALRPLHDEALAKAEPLRAALKQAADHYWSLRRGCLALRAKAEMEPDTDAHRRLRAEIEDAEQAAHRAYLAMREATRACDGPSSEEKKIRHEINRLEAKLGRGPLAHRSPWSMTPPREMTPQERRKAESSRLPPAR